MGGGQGVEEFLERRISKTISFVDLGLGPCPNRSSRLIYSTRVYSSGAERYCSDSCALEREMPPQSRLRNRDSLTSKRSAIFCTEVEGSLL